MASLQRRFWYVQEFTDGRPTLAIRLPLNTNGKQIQTLLQRLASRHLSPEQLVRLALEKHHGDAFRPHVSNRSLISLEVERRRYMAQIVSEFQLSEMQASTTVSATKRGDDLRTVARTASRPELRPH